MQQATKSAEAMVEQLRLDLVKSNAQLEELDKLKGQLQQLRDDIKKKEDDMKDL